MSQDRRTFIKRSGAAVGVALTGGVAAGDQAGADDGGGRTGRAPALDPTVLRAVADVVLPAELSAVEREEAVADFEDWAAGYEPVAEMNHGYGTSEIRYGPPDPVPGWTAQLEALDLEARRRTGTAFADLDATAKRELLERQDLDRGTGLPNPLRADHVAVALMAHWFGSPRATDLCYRRRIGVQLCRGIDNAPEEPEAIR